MSMRARSRRCAGFFPLSAAGVTQSSAKLPSTAGRHSGPGFTKSVLSTNVPDGVPETAGKMHTSGVASSTKSSAAARASETCGGSRGTTGKRLRCFSSRPRASSIFLCSGRRTRPARSTGLSASDEVMLTLRPLISTWAGFGRNLTPRSASLPRALPSAGSSPSATFSGGCGSGWKHMTSSREGTRSTSVGELPRRSGARHRERSGSTWSE
mmetsp:Transcript_43243/g.128114  ORF Transcript_43243/g.128114 Transcript_43243/m.128114 type:complete len:211 (+) Transcript_43243:115-747(+)